MGGKTGRKDGAAGRGRGGDSGSDSEYFDDLPPARKAVRSAQAAYVCKREAAGNVDTAVGAVESMAESVPDYSAAAALAHTAAAIAVRACRAYAKDAAVAAGAASITSEKAASDAKSSANHAALADFALDEAISAREGSRLMCEAAVAAACAKSSAASVRGGQESATDGSGKAQ